MRRIYYSRIFQLEKLDRKYKSEAHFKLLFSDFIKYESFFFLKNLNKILLCSYYWHLMQYRLQCNIFYYILLHILRIKETSVRFFLPHVSTIYRKQKLFSLIKENIDAICVLAFSDFTVFLFFYLLQKNSCFLIYIGLC